MGPRLAADEFAGTMSDQNGTKTSPPGQPETVSLARPSDREREQSVMESPLDRLSHPLVIAHRGGGALAPENTMSAFELADSSGADVLEADVQPSRDGRIMVIHDATVDRTSNGSGSVAALTLGELKSLDFGWRFDPPGETGHSLRGRGVTIPTLEELFDRLPGRVFSIDIRSKDSRFAAEVVRLVVRRGLTKHVIFGSFWHGVTRSLLRATPRVAVSADTLAGLRLLAASYLPVPRRWIPRADAYMLPARLGSLRTVTPLLVQTAHRAGRRVYAWTVDDPELMRALLGIGADGIITNRTDIATAVRREFLARWRHGPVDDGTR